MLSRLLPPRIDNDYRGSRIALWLFGLFLFVKMAMSVNCIFNGARVATSADGIPLASFSPAAAQVIVFDFAAWGLAHLVIVLIGILALVRYRSMVPLMFTLFLFEHLSRRALHQFLLTQQVGTPPGTYVNVTLLGILGIGLALSLMDRKREVVAMAAL